MVDIAIPESAKKYMALQCNSVLSDYTDCSEFSLIWDKYLAVLPKEVNFLELGAGIGRISVYLHKCLQRNAHYYLVDGDSGNAQICGMNYSAGPNYYNSWRAAEEFCTANGIPSDRVHLVLPGDLSPIPLESIDVCLSAKAFGFHWPIAAYLDAVHTRMKLYGLLAFEMRSTLSACYDTDARHKRAITFNKYQLDQINLRKYSVLYHKIDVINPVLLLQKVAV